MPTRCMHASGYHSGDIEAYAAWLYDLATEIGARKVTTTETRRLRHRRAFRAAFPKRQWSLRKSGEYLCLARRDTFQVLTVRNAMAIVTRVPRLVKWRQMHVARFDLRHRESGRRNRTWPYHAPSGVEYGDDWRETNRKQVAAHKRGTGRLGKRMARFDRNHPDAVQDAPGDSNVDHHRDRWVDYMEDQLGCRSVWRATYTTRGTHGRRLIDTANVMGADVVDAFVTRKPPARFGYDHGPFVYDVEF